MHSCGGSFYKITIDNAEKGEKFEIVQKAYYLYKCPIDGEEIYVRRATGLNEYKKIEAIQHCEKIVTYEKGTQYSIQVKRTMNDNKSSTKTLSNVTLNTDNHSHTNACYAGHNHTVNRCTPIYHKHNDNCYDTVKRENYFDMKLNADGSNAYKYVYKSDWENFVAYRKSDGKKMHTVR